MYTKHMRDFVDVIKCLTKILRDNMRKKNVLLFCILDCTEYNQGDVHPYCQTFQAKAKLNVALYEE